MKITLFARALRVLEDKNLSRFYRRAWIFFPEF
jgi:hypothetical protein